MFNLNKLSPVMEVKPVADAEKAVVNHEVDPKINTLSFMQDIVGGYIEIFPRPFVLGGVEWLIILNEEGTIRGLPLNPIASALATEAVGRLTQVCGTVLLVDNETFQEWDRHVES